MPDQPPPLALQITHSTVVNEWLGEPLPPELIKAIVDELQDDQATLIACSLASSYFSAPCREYLFSKIHLYQDEQQRIKDLLSIFMSNPSLGIHVRSLTLTLHHDHDPDETTLPSLLSMFSRLRQLSFGQRSSNSRVSWAHLTSKLRSAIFGLLWSDTLLEAKIAYFINFPLWALCGRSSLAKLRIVDVFPPRDGNDADNSQIIVPPLGVHSLDITLSHDTFRSHHSLLLEMQRIICPSSLRVLEISLFCTTQVQDECHKWVKDCSKQMDYHLPTQCCNASTYPLAKLISHLIIWDSTLKVISGRDLVITIMLTSREFH